MKLATVRNGTPDGQLIVVSEDGARYVPVGTGGSTLQSALDNWDEVQPAMQALSKALNAGEIDGSVVQPENMAAPLPRAWQWLDGSVYASHAKLMETLSGIEVKKVDKPLMYQGVSDKFHGPTDDVPFLTEDHNIDFEGEFGIIVDEVPAGISAKDAAKHIKLVVQINDWSARHFAFTEIVTGFGWIAAKPHCAVAPFACTPDELGKYWKDNRVQLKLRVDWNGAQFGNAHGGDMSFGFNELVAHAAQTRPLVAGTIIGSGTVSNENFREVGSSCIAERRGIETLDDGEPKTNWMCFGDRVRMEARTPDDKVVFGAIDQQVIQY